MQQVVRLAVVLLLLHVQEHFFAVPEPGKMAARINWRIPKPNGDFIERSVVQVRGLHSISTVHRGPDGNEGQAGITNDRCSVVRVMDHLAAVQCRTASTVWYNRTVVLCRREGQLEKRTDRCSVVQLGVPRCRQQLLGVPTSGMLLHGHWILACPAMFQSLLSDASFVTGQSSTVLERRAFVLHDRFEKHSQRATVGANKTASTASSLTITSASRW
jgi:hypothetical protein